MHDPDARKIWAVIEVDASKLQLRGRGVAETLQLSGLSPAFHPVADRVEGTRTIRRFEQIVPVVYAHRAADDVMDVIETTRPLLWRTVTAEQPYRRYYLYLAPTGEIRLPQIVGTYALTFFLGSLSRYRPAYLLDLLDHAYGPFVREFLATEPQQLIYRLASEFKRQEVSRASLV